MRPVDSVQKCGGGQEKITDFDRVSYLYSW